MRVYAVTLLKYPWTNKGVDAPREQTPALQRAGVDSLPGNERCQPVRLASPGKPLYGGYMRFSQENIEGNSISAFASGQVTVNGEAITTSVIVTPKCIIRDWLPAVFDEMEASHLERFGQLDPEIILIGTGETLRFPPASWTAAYLARGIGVEFMDTAAACRTYNVLLSEDRRVVAALLIG